MSYSLIDADVAAPDAAAGAAVLVATLSEKVGALGLLKLGAVVTLSALVAISCAGRAAPLTTIATCGRRAAMAIAPHDVVGANAIPPFPAPPPPPSLTLMAAMAGAGKGEAAPVTTLPAIFTVVACTGPPTPCPTSSLFSTLAGEECRGIPDAAWDIDVDAFVDMGEAVAMTLPCGRHTSRGWEGRCLV